jgi:hypothetical protein
MKQQLAMLREQKLLEWAVVVIQRHWRAKLARDAARALREENRRKWLASVQIQRIIRGYWPRQLIKRLRRERDARLIIAIFVQRFFRGSLGREYARWWRVQVETLGRLLQRMARGHLGRMESARQRVAIKAWWKWLDPGRHEIVQKCGSGSGSGSGSCRGRGRGGSGAQEKVDQDEDQDGPSAELVSPRGKRRSRSATDVELAPETAAAATKLELLLHKRRYTCTSGTEIPTLEESKWSLEPHTQLQRSSDLQVQFTFFHPELS